MNTPIKKSRSLLTRLLASNLLLVGSLVLLLATLFLIMQYAELEHQLTVRAEALADFLANQSEFAMLVGDREELARIARNVLAVEDVLFVVASEESGEDLIRVSRSDFPIASIPADGNPDAGPATLGGMKLIQVERPVLAPHEAGLVDWEAKKSTQQHMGSVRIGFSLAGERRFIDRTIGYVLVVALMCLTVIMSVQYLQLRRLLQPLKTLTDFTHRIAAGKLDQNAPVGRLDEVGQLALSFNEMTDTLRLTTVSKNYVDNIIQSMGESLVVLDTKLVIRTVNKATVAMLCRSEGDLIGQPFADVLSEQNNADVLGSLWLESAGGFSGVERFYRGDGEEIPVLLFASVLRDDSGVVEGVVCLAQDMRERKRFEHEVLVAKEAAVAANRAKSAFLANMSHEIRTPLNAIMGYTQLMLRNDAISAGVKSNLNIINRSGDHLLTLINEILDMSKIEAGRMNLTPATFELPALLENVAAMFRLKAEAKRLEFDLVVDPDSAQVIVADQGKLRQVLVNLLGNAIKFTEHGSVKMRVSTHRRTNDLLWLAVEVEDTGIGISGDEQGAIFRPFVQAHNNLNVQPGTGLGLAISREYARLMGGDIIVVSRVGEGTVFRLAIPVETGDTRGVAPAPALRRVVGLQAGQRIPLVLIVDDSATNRDWLNQLLTSLGFSIREAENGEESIRIWMEWKPDLILMDIRMPVMDGLEAARRIREAADPAAPKTVIFALTASAMDQDRQSFMRGDIDKFISKPCREAELLAAFEVYLGVEYIYENEAVGADSLSGLSSSLQREALARLSAELISELQQAILNGEKDRVDELIERVKERDAPFANALQELADKYEYDALTRLFKGEP